MIQLDDVQLENDVRELRRRFNSANGSAAGIGPANEEPPGVAPAGPSLTTRRPLSAGQIRAIFDAMRTFRDDDVSRAGDAATFICDRCERRRQFAGSLVYGDLRLCNGCATDYELLRTAGMEYDIFTADHKPPSGETTLAASGEY